MKVYISKELQELFAAKAEKIFPREELCFLLGTQRGQKVFVENIYFPEGRLVNSTEEQILITEKFILDAVEVAKQHKLEVVGTIHSHCFSKKSDFYEGANASYEDFKTFGRYVKSLLPSAKTFGVYRINKNLRVHKTYLDFWPAEAPYEVIDGKKQSSPKRGRNSSVA